MLRNALVAAELNELDDPKYELDPLRVLIEALFEINSIDEVEPLVLRYKEAAKAQSGKEGFCFAEFNSLLCSAQLHEVLCLCTPRWESLTTALALLPARPYSVWLSHIPPCPRRMHLLNLALSAGTREASRGCEGGARSARPDARKRGRSAEICHCL